MPKCLFRFYNSIVVNAFLRMWNCFHVKQIKRQEAELDVAELRMLRLSLGVLRSLGDSLDWAVSEAKILDKTCWIWSCQVGGKRQRPQSLAPLVRNLYHWRGTGTGPPSTVLWIFFGESTEDLWFLHRMSWCAAKVTQMIYNLPNGWHILFSFSFNSLMNRSLYSSPRLLIIL